MGKLSFLGTGTSTGVPVIGCDCDVCGSINPKDNRLRSSVWIEERGSSMLIDTTTDFRAQALRANINRLDAVFFTHHHADHVHGIDELRTFNYYQKQSIPCYGNEETLERIRSMFTYIFDGLESKGGAKPSLDLRLMDGPVKIGDAKITPVPVMHGDMEVYGYRMNGLAYVTDCSKIPDASVDALQGLNTLILGALGLKQHNTHFTMEEALAVIEKLAPKKAYLTHLNHNTGHDTTKLPDNVELAWDGLEVEI